jgi:uncharacterized membrane-anchored protein YitT (DUF2179 family)
MDTAKFFKLTIKNQRFNYKNNVTLFLNIKMIIFSLKKIDLKTKITILNNYIKIEYNF